MNWEAIIYTVLWVVGGLVVLGILAWVVVASLAARAFKATSREFQKTARTFTRGF